jgi:hypothetical protein
LPFELGWRTSDTSSTSAFCAASMKAPILAISSGSGSAPASECSSARAVPGFALSSLLLFIPVRSRAAGRPRPSIQPCSAFTR